MKHLVATFLFIAVSSSVFAQPIDNLDCVVRCLRLNYPASTCDYICNGDK